MKQQFLAGVGCDVILRVTLLSASSSTFLYLDAAEEEAMEDGDANVAAAPADSMASAATHTQTQTHTPMEEDSGQPGLGLDGGHTVDVPCHSLMHVWMPSMQDEPLFGGLKREVGFSFDLEVGSVKMLINRFFDGNLSSKTSEVFNGGPWEEIVREDSPYFSKGELKVSLTMRKMTR
jgi:hypothetical protein